LEDKILSQGQLVYSRTAGLRWEVTAPYESALIYNGKKLLQVVTDQQGQIQKRVLNSEFMLIEMMGQIKNWLSGEAFAMTDQYKIELIKNDPVTIRCTPINQELKKMLGKLEFVFNEKLDVVKRLVITEGSGDITKINYYDIQKNIEIKQSLFE